MARKSSRIPAYLTPEEIVRLFAAITSTRDRAIFRLAYHRGLRAKTDALTVTVGGVGGGGNVPLAHTLAQNGALTLTFDGVSWF